MSTIALIWEIALICSLLALLFMMQDWSKFWFFKKYLKNRELQRDRVASEKLLEDLPKGVVRYTDNKIPQNKGI